MTVAVIGSSGGGAATLGHTDPLKLLRTIHKELSKVACGENGISNALFVSLDDGIGLDNANPDLDMATLYSVHGPQDISVGSHECPVRVERIGTLSQVNETCRKLDVTVADAIRQKKVHGLICISCDVNIHSKTLQAAAEMNIPVTGSGGTSLSAAATQFGVLLVGNAGGSVATTSYTRAVSYTHALATAWKKQYQPFTAKSFIRPQWKSVLNACLPAFWAVCLACRIIQKLLLSVVGEMQWIGPAETLRQLQSALQTVALPSVCCVVMATSCAPQHGSTAVMAACVAAMACDQSILSGLFAGWLVASMLSRALYRCISWGVPATMTNLLVAGGVGAFAAALVSPVAPILKFVTMWIRLGILTSMDGTVPGAGFMIGCLFCYGSKVGYYHTLCLPFILVEMELGEASLWGAIDECTLVLVSAGICAANLMLAGSQDAADISLCRRAVRINILYGDFIEAAYPFMERHVLVNIAGYLASGISTEILSQNPEDVLSLAYLPFPISIWLTNDWQRMALACLTAFGVSFAGTLLNGALVTSTRTKQA